MKCWLLAWIWFGVFAAATRAGTQISQGAFLEGRLADRPMPLNLTPFTWREMNFDVRLEDIAIKAHGLSDRPFARIPPRAPTAVSGSEFLAKTATLPKPDREAAILAELRSCNIPSFLRRLKPVRMASRSAFGDQHIGIVWVTPDYMAIGHDEDFVRIPMTLAVAERFAREFRYVLPTRKLVDAIYEQADIKLTPQPLPYGPSMETNEFYARSQLAIEAELKAQAAHYGELIAGHKKDLVIGLGLWRSAPRILIYGWHMPDSNPIQPLSNAHLANYADYSHGVRLVSRMAILDGRPVDFAEVVSTISLAPPFSYVPIPWFYDRFVNPPRLPGRYAARFN